MFASSLRPASFRSVINALPKAGGPSSAASRFVSFSARRALPRSTAPHAAAASEPAVLLHGPEVRFRQEEFAKKGGWMRFGIIAGGTVATVVVTNAFLNRETRESLSGVERSLLNSTFMYSGAGLSMTGLAAYALHKNGVSYRLMRANPLLVAGVGIGASLLTMFATFNTAPNSAAKHLSWASFNLVQGLLLAPLCFVNPAILLRAGLYTTGIIGSISYVGATAKEEKFLYIGGPLIAGLSVVALSSLAPLVLPVTALRTLAISESLSLYGGLAIFPFCTLNHVQTILLHAREGKHDPAAESLGIELDFINIFIRLVAIIGGNNNKRH